MTADDQAAPPPNSRAGSAGFMSRVPRRTATLLGLVVVALVILAVVRLIGDARRLMGNVTGRTSISQEIVIEQIRAVAQLVSSEMTVRDVVTFENTRYGSTKRALIVVTGRILAGIDLDQGTEVRIDSAARRIVITIPEARVLAIDIVSLRTYDEQRGLWNPFQPEDRDAIYQDVRRQLHRTAADLGVVKRANTSAARMLETMFSVDGYTAEVRFAAPSAPLDGRVQPLPPGPAKVPG
jgi:hypothetical protein